MDWKPERNIKSQLRQIIPKWQYSMSSPREVAKNGWWSYENDELCWHIHRDAFKSKISGRVARNFKIFPAKIAKQLDLDVDFSRFQQGGEA